MKILTKRIVDLDASTRRCIREGIGHGSVRPSIATAASLSKPVTSNPARVSFPSATSLASILSAVDVIYLSDYYTSSCQPYSLT